MLNEIYMTTIQPIIDYGITVWSTVPKYCINRIQRLQNFCARIINNNFDFINTRGLDLVKQMGWMNVVERVDYFTNLLIYKCINQVAPVYLQNEIILCSEIKKRELRNNKNLDVYIPLTSNGHKDRSIFIRGAKHWNSLPLNIRNSKSLQTFKYKLEMTYKL